MTKKYDDAKLSEIYMHPASNGWNCPFCGACMTDGDGDYECNRQNVKEDPAWKAFTVPKLFETIRCEECGASWECVYELKGIAAINNGPEPEEEEEDA